MLLFLGGIGGAEIMFIFLIVLLLFGSKKIPEFARGLGKGIRQFKDAADGIQRDITRETNSIKDQVEDKKQDS